MTYEDVKRIRANPTMTDVDKEELARMIDEAIELQSHICADCKYNKTKANLHPCVICSRRFKDYWISKDDEAEWFDE